MGDPEAMSFDQLNITVKSVVSLLSAICSFRAIGFSSRPSTGRYNGSLRFQYIFWCMKFALSAIAGQKHIEPELIVIRPFVSDRS